MRAEPIRGDVQTGQLWVFGQSRVEQALLAGSSTSLTKFRAEASMKKLPERKTNGIPTGEFFVSGLIRLSVKASGTESRQAADY